MCVTSVFAYKCFLCREVLTNKCPSACARNQIFADSNLLNMHVLKYQYVTMRLAPLSKLMNVLSLSNYVPHENIVLNVRNTAGTNDLFIDCVLPNWLQTSSLGVLHFNPAMCFHSCNLRHYITNTVEVAFSSKFPGNRTQYMMFFFGVQIYTLNIAVYSHVYNLVSVQTYLVTVVGISF